MRSLKNPMLILPFCLFILIAGVVTYSRFTEPEYDGKTLDEWLYEVHIGQTYPYKRARAVEAFQALRSDSVPYLVSKSLLWEETAFSKVRRFYYETVPRNFRGTMREPLDTDSWNMYADQMLDEIKPDSDELIPLIQHLLESEDPKYLGAGIFLLRFLGEGAEEAVPHLVNGLKSSDPRVLSFAVSSAEFLGNKVSGVVPYLIADFRKNGMGDSFVALASMGSAATNALPDIIALFHEVPEGQHKKLTAGVLLSIDPTFQEAKEVLVDALQVENPTLPNIAQASMWIGRLGENGKFAENALLHFLEDRDQTLVGRVLVALKDIGTDKDRIIQGLLTGLEQRTIDAQIHQIKMVLEIDPTNQKNWGLLLPFLDEENLHRLVALQAISSLGPDAKPAARRVEALVNDSDRNVANAARAALENIEE